MAAAEAIALPKKSQKAFQEYYKSIQLSQNTNRSSLRERLSEIDRQYMREKDRTEANLRAKAANTAGDADRMQNITVPVVKTQVDTATDYQASVFLTGHPLFGVVSDPAYIDQALQMETVLEEQAVKGGWVKELTKFFRNGFKYNFAPIEVDWTKEVTYDIQTDTEKSLTQGVPTEIIWEGNRVRALDPYNVFLDTSVPASEVYKRGGYAGYTEYMTRIELKDYISKLTGKIVANVKPALESSTSLTTAQNSTSQDYFIPDINPTVSGVDNVYGGTDWMQWAGLSDYTKDIDYKDAYQLTTLYCRILPAEFNLKVPSSNTPQIYKVVLVNHQWIIYAERQTNAHNYLPILVGQPAEDGLSYQTKSLANDATPFQSVTSAYMNSIVASRRRAISDRVLFDPSRVTSAHINSANPSAKIPVRPSAYGKNVSDAVYAFPYREDQAANSVSQIQMLLGLANNLAGQNQATQGQFVKGNKTVAEFESVMGNANSSDQVMAMLLEDQVFVPMKYILKINVLQFQGGTTIYNREAKKAVVIDPVALRKAVLEFKISDGLVPSSKIMSADTFGVALQAISTSPQLSQGYNVAPMFSYLMKSQGADIAPFEKSSAQVAYEQAVQQWQQMIALAMEKEVDPSTIGPQPTPEQFGYDPQQNTPQPATTSAPNSAGTAETQPQIAQGQAEPATA